MGEKKSVFISKQQQTIINRHLKRMDAGFLGTVLVTGKACIYRFQDRWIEMGIEGPLYLYTRNAHPLHRLLVLNRKSLNDFKMDIPDRFNCESKERFIIFNSENREAAFGFWFEDEEDASALFRALEELQTN